MILYIILETKIKMYKDEKKLSQDMVQKLQYEVISLKKRMEMNCNNGCCEDIINQYKIVNIKDYNALLRNDWYNLWTK